MDNFHCLLELGGRVFVHWRESHQFDVVMRWALTERGKLENYYKDYGSSSAVFEESVM